MHGIHNTTVREEADSNWSSSLTLWDRLHGTLRLNVPQDIIVIGVPAYRAPAELTVSRLLTMPFGKQPSALNSSAATRQDQGEALAPRRHMLR
ncbi:sterol desaturase family protein [Desulfocurvibacter africanus]|uniref:sterol desaturase family protein n=1 Tax=Desulfocurvibacter africanus TaxID=873 RepID=UPI000693767E|nr:hypothetical protein [Desulfocurvibacter africanus]